MIELGLEDLSISRAQIEWGVPVPWDPGQTIYVWIDALLNYWTALQYARPGEDLTERFWPPDLQLMAKDILKFHAVIWPAMLMSAGLELPRRLMIHGYVLKGGEKMSKTTGNVVDPFPFIDQYGIDALRYYLVREVRFGEDGTFTAEGFEARYSGELANELGNLLNRVVSMVGRYRDGVVPADPGDGGGAARPRWPRPSTRCARTSRSSTCRAPPRTPGAWCSASTGWSRSAPPGPSRRTRTAPASSTPPSSRSPRACGRWRSCSGRSSPAPPSASWRPSARTRPTWRSPRRPGAPAARRRPSRPQGPLFPRVEEEAA